MKWHMEALHWRKEWSRMRARAEQAERERDELRRFVNKVAADRIRTEITYPV